MNYFEKRQVYLQIGGMFTENWDDNCDYGHFKLKKFNYELCS